ncbi:MAG: peptidase U32 family protein [Candidatus Freyarchaeota archaeon]|nr:peptidase U32 family protein [Candidatus Freyrarchaeum guaymaensis]
MRLKILAPAGGWNSLLAAVKVGADVVYLGGKAFNARQYAENFSLDEMRRAVEFSHAHGTEVYVTVNTLIFDEELEAVAHYLEDLYDSGVDAVIFQDLAVLKLAKRFSPKLKLIASTQTTTHNVEAVRFFEKLGVDGVILSRELSLDEIREIRSKTDLWLETFVHGALCFSYSGACLMSSIIGGRSGNRGRCAQPCRKRYSLLSSKGKVLAEGHLLSMKDLNLSKHLRELVDAGVDSLKIEGRMRRPEYVATTVDVYRKALIAALKGLNPNQRDIKRLSLVFNRGFTEGYLYGGQGREMMNYERPDNVGVKVGVVSSTKRGFLTISLSEDLRVGDGVEIACNGEKVGFIVRELRVGGRKVEVAKPGEEATLPFNGKVRVGAVVHKTRDVLTVEWTEQLIRNALREASHSKAKLHGRGRSHGCEEAVSTTQSSGSILAVIRGGVAYSPAGERTIQRPASAEGESASLLKLSVSVGDLESIRRAVDAGAERVIFGGDFFKPRKPLSFNRLGEGVDYCREHGVEFILSTPRITRNRELQLIKESLNHVKSLNPDGVIVGNYGTLNLFLEEGFSHVYADYFLNVTNSLSISIMRELGVKGVTLSPELTLKQIASLHKDGVEVECIVHGPLELMVSEHCILRSILSPSGRCSSPCVKDSYFLRDEKGFLFPLACDQSCRLHVFNSRDLCMVDELGRVADAGADYVRVDARLRKPEHVQSMVKAYREVIDGRVDSFEAKKRLRGVGASFTRGHFFRGVL